MGDAKPYYKDLLKNFAYCLMSTTDAKLAEKVEMEQDTQKLESLILETKKEMPAETFFYHAGIAVMSEFGDVFDTDGNDDINACISGISLFEEFIGLPKFVIPRKEKNYENNK